MIAICDDVLFIVLPIFVFFYFFISLETAKTQRAKTESDNPAPSVRAIHFIRSADALPVPARIFETSTD